MDIMNMNNLYATEMYRTTTILKTVHAGMNKSNFKKARWNGVENRTKQIDKGSDLYKACQDFEAIFIKQMLNVMKKTINKSGLIDGGFAEEVFEDMLYDEYAKKMAENAGFGLSDSLYRQLSQSDHSNIIV
ncbi:MAG: rod-binding protein [Spirochaetales bacterium]|nr:rod-binding protein [Spirochaetales bacterium]